MDHNNLIPQGRFADDDVAKAKREALRQKLLTGGTITLKNNGSVADTNGTSSSIIIPQVKLADDDVARAKREALRQKLLMGGTITLKNNGSATDTEGIDSSIIPQGKLAAEQWYQKNPELLALEKMAMKKAFPNFELEQLEDGSLAWVGKLDVGVYESKFNEKIEYNIMALYMPNHPHQQMGSSVRVYPILPDVTELIDKCGFRPFHLLCDSNNDLYLCTNEANNQHTGDMVTSAASVLGWACKWFLAYELVLTGELSRDKFNQHGGI